ncbi:MAG TPA: signal peptidase I [Bdellovibrionales bacterium]|nr:signal peptidase I [Bdellovibrionales bacterium]
MSVLTRRFWTEGPGSFLVAVGLALIVRWAFFEAYVIPSTSMLPTLLVHDHIFVNKIIYGVRAPFSEKWFVQWAHPKRGEVLVFKYPADKEKYFIKRVVGLPGDRVLYENGNLYVNEKLVERTIPQSLKDEWLWLNDGDFPGDVEAGGRALYVHWEERLDGGVHSVILRKDVANQSTFGPVTVPDGHYMVLGDNRDNSQDSRAWAEGKRFVPRDYLIGRASLVWLSCETTLPVLTFLCNPLEIRWQRLLHSVR